MKHIRKFAIVVVFIIIASTFMGCARKELSEVYTKVSDNEISLLSQNSQLVILDITIEEESELKFQKKIEINANEVKVIKLEDITDTSFFNNNPRIVEANVIAQKSPKIEAGRAFTIIWLSLLGLCVTVFIISDILAIRKKTYYY